MAKRHAIACIVANSYCTPDDIRSLLDSSGLSVFDTPKLTLVAGYASRLIDTLCNRDEGAFYPDATPTVNYYDGNGEREFYTDDFASITEVAVDEAGAGTYTVWSATTDYWPIVAGGTTKGFRVNTATARKAGWPKQYRSVRVTGVKGASATPPDIIKYATVVQAVRMIKRALQAYADVGAVIEIGQLRYVQEVDPEVRNIINDAAYYRSAFG